MYAKLFQSIYSGSLATRGPWQALVTFQNMLVLADRFGIVDMTPEAISRQTTLPLELIQIGIKALEQPDPESRRPDANGCRITLLDPEQRNWGWQIVNYEHYRAIKNAEERRDYQRQYMAKYRKRAKPEVGCRRCHYCEQPAVKLTNDIAHCANPAHLDHALARRM